MSSAVNVIVESRSYPITVVVGPQAGRAGAVNVIVEKRSYPVTVVIGPQVGRAGGITHELEELRDQVSADRAQTGLDRIETGLDRAATAADRVQTGLDRDAAAQAAADAIAAHNADLAAHADLFEEKSRTTWSSLLFGGTVTLDVEVAGGVVLHYNYGTTTYYRYIATDNSIDAFYSAFDGTMVSGLVATRALNF